MGARTLIATSLPADNLCRTCSNVGLKTSEIRNVKMICTSLWFSLYPFCLFYTYEVDGAGSRCRLSCKLVFWLKVMLVIPKRIRERRRIRRRQVIDAVVDARNSLVKHGERVGA